jgi:putative ABC transport system permease protein
MPAGRRHSRESMRLILPIVEIFKTAHQALLRNWGRAVLTSLSMVVGTASIVLVVIVGISGKAYTLEQIRGVGTNLISIYPESADAPVGIKTQANQLNPDDQKAIQMEVPGVRDSAPLINSYPTITLEGITRRVSLIGTTPSYQQVRNLKVLSGSFIGENDERFRNKVCVITELLAKRLDRDPFYKGFINLYGIQFNVIGVFKERVNTFGQTEVTDYSAVIPLSVMRYFRDDDGLNQIYVSAQSMEVVTQVSAEIHQLLLNRHRNHAFFKVDNLTEILKAADKISTGLTVVLLVIAAISLIASGISIMNVMLITVTERTREIGIKKSIGAYRRVLLTEFLVEALILSSGGGFVGVFLGVAAPYSVRFFTTAIKIEIPPIAIILGFGVTLLVGLTFGMIPALRAARMNPVEALRYE